MSTFGNSEPSICDITHRILNGKHKCGLFRMGRLIVIYYAQPNVVQDKEKGQFC